MDSIPMEGPAWSPALSAQGESEQTVDFRDRPLLHLRGWGACGCRGSGAPAALTASKDPQ